jgi:hypothetical protein
MKVELYKKVLWVVNVSQGSFSFRMFYLSRRKADRFAERERNLWLNSINTS